MTRNAGQGGKAQPPPSMRNSREPIKPPPDEGNSRSSAAEGGWSEDTAPGRARWRGLLEERRRTRWGNYSWISLTPLLSSINDVLVKGLDDLINEIRPRWVASQRERTGAEDMVIQPADLDKNFSFLVLGDPGEQDASQYAVVAPMLAEGGDTDFMVIDSDVIYPAGDVNDYLDGFYLPYRDYDAPIYAIPGNHDWYDGLNGFMWHFCSGANALPPVAYRAGGYSWNQRLARALWRKPSPPQLPQLFDERERLTHKRGHAHQPGPYFCIRVGGTEKSKKPTDPATLLIVCIDTGITGALDREQGDWLRRVSCLPGPKILITGKPIYVDGKYHPGKIDWGPEDDPQIQETGFESVDDIVRNQAHDYRAVIGGDIHNYQRYSVHVKADPKVKPCPDGETKPPGERLIHYLVAGGSGAYLSAAHAIPRVDLKPMDANGRRVPVRHITEEKSFWCYPLRGDSLARFASRCARGFGLALAIALAIVLGTAIYFLLSGDIDHEMQKFKPVEELSPNGVDGDHGGGELWKAMLTVPGTIIAALLVVGFGAGVSYLIAPKGFRTMAGVLLTLASGALLLFGINELVRDWDNLVWKMMLGTLMAVGVPLLGTLAYYLMRDFIAPAIRVAICLAIPLGLGLVLVLNRIDDHEEGALVVGLFLLVLWAGVLAVAGLRRFGSDPKNGRLRFAALFVGRVLPVTLLIGGLVWGLVLVRDESWIPVALLIGFLGTVVTLAFLVLVIGWRALRAVRWLLSRSVNPDETARWLADKLDTNPVRVAAREAVPSTKTKRLASMVYDTRLLRSTVSVLAEATEPPFFKSFLKLEVKRGWLTISTYGVTGRFSDEQTPTLEDEVKIKLAAPS